MPNGTTRTSGLNLRSSLAPGKVIKVLRKSTRVEVLGEETWLRVRTSDGEEGFVFGDFVERDLPPDRAEASFAVGPSADYRPEQFHRQRFIGKPVIADVDFIPALERIADFAEETNLSVLVTSSARDPGGHVNGAIVKPADRSNHLVGHAIDFNLQSDAGEVFNSAKLKQLAQQPPSVQRFIELVRKDGGLRWGGDFSTPDVVHIDDGLNVRAPGLWNSKFESRD